MRSIYDDSDDDDYTMTMIMTMIMMMIMMLTPELMWTSSATRSTHRTSLQSSFLEFSCFHHTETDGDSDDDYGYDNKKGGENHCDDDCDEGYLCSDPLEPSPQLLPSPSHPPRLLVVLTPSDQNHQNHI